MVAPAASSASNSAPVLHGRKHELAGALVDMVRGGLGRMYRVGGHDVSFRFVSAIADALKALRAEPGVRATGGRPPEQPIGDEGLPE